MMKENWIDDMKRKLEGHQMDPPPGLWDDICKQMGLSPEPVRKSVAKRWYWAAAAGILVLVGFFAVHQTQELDTAPKQAQIATSDSLSRQEQPELLNEDVQPNLLAKEETHKRSAHRGSGPAVRFVSHEGDTPSEPSSETTAVEQVPDEPQQTENLELKENAEAKQSTQQSNHKFQTSLPSKAAEPSANFKHQTNKWSVGVNASGGLLAANNSVRTDRLYYDNSVANDHEYYLGYDDSIANVINEKPHYNSYTTSYPKSYTNTDFVSKHHLPVRFGVSVQYQLNPHLALLSGINYTRLSSEFSIPLYPNIHYNQKLHYLGIPDQLYSSFFRVQHPALSQHPLQSETALSWHSCWPCLAIVVNKSCPFLSLWWGDGRKMCACRLGSWQHQQETLAVVSQCGSRSRIHLHPQTWCLSRTFARLFL